MAESLLLHFDGTDGATTTIDSSSYGHTVTLSGGPHLEIDDKKFEPTSLRTEKAVTRYVRVAAHTSLDLGSSEFEIDLWINPDQDLTTDLPTFLRQYVDANNAWWLWHDPTWGLIFVIVNSGVEVINLYNPATGHLTENVWSHIRVNRIANDWYLSINGIEIATVNASTSFPSFATTDLEIATEDLTGVYEAQGYFDEIRIQKGSYTLAPPFTIPTSPWPYPHRAANQLSQPFGIRMAKQLDQAFSLKVANQLTQPIHFSVANQLTQPFSLRKKVANQLSQIFDLLLKNPVANQLTQPFSLRIANQLSQPHSINGKVANQLSQPHSLTVRVANQLSQPHELLLRNPVANQLSQRFDLLAAPAINITDQPYILFNSKKVEIKTASISSGENSFIWDAQIELSKVEDYALFNQDDEIELNLLGENYTLIIVNKNMNRTGGSINTPIGISMTLTASSPAIKYAFPRAIGITKIWDVATLAKDIAEEVTGEIIDWQLVDWYIPVGKLSVTNAAPISIVQQLAEVAGGVVESKKDGSLLVRHAYPISVKDWDNAAVDQSYSDIADNLSISESYNYIDHYNKVLITDGFDESSADSIEYEADEDTGLAGTIRVYPNPYRAIELYHTSLNHIGLIPQGEVIRTEIAELVEFKGGKASTSYPVHSIVSVDYKYDNLGAISFTADKKDISASINDGYSLALITYEVRSYNFRVSSPVEEAVQFIIRGS